MSEQPVEGRTVEERLRALEQYLRELDGNQAAPLGIGPMRAETRVSLSSLPRLAPYGRPQRIVRLYISWLRPLLPVSTPSRAPCI